MEIAHRQGAEDTSPDEGTPKGTPRLHGGLTPVGWEAPERLTYEEWEETGHALNRLDTAVKWARGDWLAYGEHKWGEKYAQAVDNAEAANMLDECYVSRSVEFSYRYENLSWTHHKAVAPLKPKEQQRWLKEAAPSEAGETKPRLTVEELRSAIKDERDVGVRERLHQTGLGFQLLYADPPWEYEGATTDPTRRIENQYSTMSLAEIEEMAPDVWSVAAEDAVLFLWSTSPKLEEAMRVIAAWGFDYRTCMVWVKDRIGMGYYARQQHELLLIARRGDPPHPEESARPPSVIEAPRSSVHSKKPAVFYSLIEEMYPEASKLELFARSEREGWKCWGDEV